MRSEVIKFECVTPCFCAGANQSSAEIRPSAIRGALRWWFRALGGSRELESEVFGGINPPLASKLQVRVSGIDVKRLPQLPAVQQNALGYMLYFPSVAGKKKRWEVNACFAPGTTFLVHFAQLRRISANAEAKLNEAMLAFRHYGVIGMHTTRGLGAVQAVDATEASWTQAEAALTANGFVLLKSPRTFDRWQQAIEEAGKWLKWDLRKKYSAGIPGASKLSALGSADPRQTSAVYFKPIAPPGTNRLQLSIFEAQHARVLGKQSQRVHTKPVLASLNIDQNPPQV